MSQNSHLVQFKESSIGPIILIQLSDKDLLHLTQCITELEYRIEDSCVFSSQTCEQKTVRIVFNRTVKDQSHIRKFFYYFISLFVLLGSVIGFVSSIYYLIQLLISG